MPLRAPLLTGAPVGLLPALILASCSLSKFDAVPCTENLECRDAFGWGYTCDTDAGLCAETETRARCDASWPEDLLSDRAAYRDLIVLGALVDRGEADAEMLAFELPIRQVNDASGLDGRRFGLIECDVTESASYDDLTLDEANLDLAMWLADEIGVPAILGPQYSSDALAVFTEVEPLGTLVMSHSATSPALTDVDGNNPTDQNPGLFWRTAPPDSLQGAAIAIDMSSRGVQHAAVIYQSGAYGEGLADVFNSELTAKGGTVDLYYFEDDNQRDEAVVDAGASDVEEVLFIASEQSDVEAFLRGAGARLEDYSSKGIFLADSAYYLAVFEATQATAGDLFPNIRGSRPTVDTSTSAYALFSTAYLATYAVDPTGSAYPAYAYDASWLLIYGAAWATYQEDGVSGLGMARGLRKVSYGDEVEIKPGTWPTVTANFETGDAVDVIGASGDLDYDPSTGETSAPIEIWYVECAGSSCTFGQHDIIEP